jgi:hypothetical protein
MKAFVVICILLFPVQHVTARVELTHPTAELYAPPFCPSKPFTIMLSPINQITWEHRLRQISNLTPTTR